MNNQETQKLRNLLAQRQWAPAVELLRKADPTSAADFFLSAPYDEQRALFHAMPVELAASLIVHLPYYHAYVLLHSLPSQEMRAVVEAMTPGERNHFLDALPEEAWQCLMDELAEAGTGAPYCAVPDAGTDAGGVTTEFAPPAVDIEPIIQARQIEKSYQQPDGRQIQVIAPVDFSVEPNTIIALLGPSGSGKSTLLRILSGLAAPSAGEVLWHGKPMSGCRPNVAIVFQSFALFPWLTVLENVEAPLLARGITHFERHRKALRALASVGLHGFESAYPKELVGRDETARRFRARAGRGAGDSVHGRAFFRAGRANRRKSARRAAGAVAGEENSNARAFLSSRTTSRKRCCWRIGSSC